MKYAHPDVLDNGPAYIRANATRALLVPSFNTGMTYADVLASTLLSATVTPADFTLSDDLDGRKLVYGGATAVASATAPAAGQSQLVFVDGTGRILWVDDQTKSQLITAGLSYELPRLTYRVPQPQ
jgi:hypothetical protein